MSNYSTHLTVATICEVDGRFLMVEEKPTESKTAVINQPAGHVEPGESFINAAIRETHEETGYLFRPESLLGMYQFNTQHSKAYYRMCFIGSATLDPRRPAIDPDILAVHWLTASEILKHPHLRSPLVLQCLNDYLNGVNFPLAAIRNIPLLT